MYAPIRSLLLRFQIFRDLREGRQLRAHRESRTAFPILVDYEVRATPRYGYGRPPHPELLALLNADRRKYAETLYGFLPFRSPLGQIPLQQPPESRTPYWLNGYVEGLDPASLYAFTSLQNPRTYLEIGSGNSTKFVRRAIDDHHLQTRIVSIDPNPTVEIDALCDEVRREPLEDTDLAVFDTLAPGDILFVDGSHRVFMNSDVVVCFLEVLPRLKQGVLVYVDDVFWPQDYPPDWIPRYYSEQYMLAVLLLAESSRYETVLPCAFAVKDPELSAVMDPLWDGPLAAVGGRGNGFWLRVR
jgi:predicted O-methyltransferase YrrM